MTMPTKEVFVSVHILIVALSSAFRHWHGEERMQRCFLFTMFWLEKWIRQGSATESHYIMDQELYVTQRLFASACTGVLILLFHLSISRVDCSTSQQHTLIRRCLQRILDTKFFSLTIWFLVHLLSVNLFIFMWFSFNGIFTLFLLYFILFTFALFLLYFMYFYCLLWFSILVVLFSVV